MYTLAIENYKQPVDDTSNVPDADTQALPSPPSVNQGATPPPSAPTKLENTPLDVHFANRSLAFSMTEEFTSAISDAREAIR